MKISRAGAIAQMTAGNEFLANFIMDEVERLQAENERFKKAIEKAERESRELHVLKNPKANGWQIADDLKQALASVSDSLKKHD